MKKGILLLTSLLTMTTIIGCSNVATNPNSNNPGGNNNSVYVEEEPYVTSLELLQAPTRTNYLVGELFDPSGIILKANWSHTDPYGNPMFEDDIKKNDLTSWTPNGPLQTTDTKVTVFYEGKSLDIPITVDESKDHLSRALKLCDTALDRDDLSGFGVGICGKILPYRRLYHSTKWEAYAMLILTDTQGCGAHILGRSVPIGGKEVNIPLLTSVIYGKLSSLSGFCPYVLLS